MGKDVGNAVEPLIVLKLYYKKDIVQKVSELPIQISIDMKGAR